MEFEYNLYTFTDKNGMKTFVAPAGSRIAVQIWWSEDTIDEGVSGPILVHESNWRSRGWDEYYGHCSTFFLGRYIHQQELEAVKTQVAPFFVIASAGYKYEGADEPAAFTAEAREAIAQIDSMFDEFKLELEFDAPCLPCDALIEGRTPSDEGIYPDTSDDELEKLAEAAAVDMIPHMHPWEALMTMRDIRDSINED